MRRLHLVAAGTLILSTLILANSRRRQALKPEQH